MALCRCNEHYYFFCVNVNIFDQYKRWNHWFSKSNTGHGINCQLWSTKVHEVREFKIGASYLSQIVLSEGYFDILMRQIFHFDFAKYLGTNQSSAIWIDMQKYKFQGVNGSTSGWFQLSFIIIQRLNLLITVID